MTIPVAVVVVVIDVVLFIVNQYVLNTKVKIDIATQLATEGGSL